MTNIENERERGRQSPFILKMQKIMSMNWCLRKFIKFFIFIQIKASLRNIIILKKKFKIVIVKNILKNPMRVVGAMSLTSRRRCGPHPKMWMRHNNKLFKAKVFSSLRRLGVSPPEGPNSALRLGPSGGEHDKPPWRSWSGKIGHHILGQHIGTYKAMSFWEIITYFSDPNHIKFLKVELSSH